MRLRTTAVVCATSLQVALWSSACLGRNDFEVYPEDTGPDDLDSSVIADFEAEAGQLVPEFKVVSDSSASGNAYVMDGMAAGLMGSGAASFTFTLAGPDSRSAYVWTRVLSPDTGRDSFHVVMDDQPELTFEDSGCVYSTAFHWVAVRGSQYSCPEMLPPATEYTLTAGSHTLRLTSREGESAVDRIVITTDPSFSPESLER